MIASTTSLSDLSPASNIHNKLMSLAREADSRQVSWYQTSSLLNDRRAHRIAFPETLLVVGVDKDPRDGRFFAVSKGIVANGRDISIDGISFQHAGPVPHRSVAISFRSPTGTETLVAKLSWCRFSRDGRYVSGGRLIRDARYASESEIDWDSLVNSAL
ncbi:MAG: hypothetical protein O3B13_18470 [Planctomycetota bacterium]|nr:hypothetical protein [Planctomycetota bacterium]